MKIKCKKCNSIIENKEYDKDYILYGNNNKLKRDSFIDLTPKESIEEVITELNKGENN